MSDWFKFYNDALDSKGLQFAVSEQPLVTSVWLVILSEASKNRCGDIKWADADFELIGMARRVNVSPPVFNQCLSLLERIGYITRHDALLSIPGWESMQSDYAKGLNRGYYKKTSEKLASNLLVSTVRGEERRGEEKRESSLSVAGARHFPECNGRPTLDEVVTKAEMIGLARWKAEDWFNEMAGCGWLDHAHRPIQDWVAVLTRVRVKWESDGCPSSPPKPRGQSSNGIDNQVTLAKEYDRVLQRIKQIKDGVARDAMGQRFYEPSEAEELAEMVKHRDALRAKLGIKI